MCDTLVFFSKVEKERSFFAKNSDRDPGEPQVVEIITDAKQNFQTEFLTENLLKYNRQLERLKQVFPRFEHPYSAIISRPTWIWGAEMGINEKGLAIGNEAVFSKEPLIADGLLGMDILRLALHNAATADEAAELIAHLLETYGQGGNGSYSGTLKYHNSFLIKDPKKAIVIESSGHNWVRKDVSDFASISNCYTIHKEHSLASESFQGIDLKTSLENRLYTFLSKGNIRQEYTGKQIEDRDKGIADVFEILRSHLSPGSAPKRGMRSICVHPGIFIRSETTSSLVADYAGAHVIVWVTSSPNPCVSLFKPLILSKNTNAFPMFTSTERSMAYFLSNRETSEFLLKNSALFEQRIQARRDALQKQFLDRIYNGIEGKTEEQLIADCQFCFDQEKEYLMEMSAFATT